MYMHFIAYIAIIAFTATQAQGMAAGIPYGVTFVSEPTISAKGCGENAYRCINPISTVENDWKNTKQCMEKLGILDTCWCLHEGQNYADVSGIDAGAFKDCCQEESGSDSHKC